jgi:hypothetical protein
LKEYLWNVYKDTFYLTGEEKLVDTQELRYQIIMYYVTGRKDFLDQIKKLNSKSVVVEEEEQFVEEKMFPRRFSPEQLQEMLSLDRSFDFEFNPQTQETNENKSFEDGGLLDDLDVTFGQVTPITSPRDLKTPDISNVTIIPPPEKNNEYTFDPKFVSAYQLTPIPE